MPYIYDLFISYAREHPVGTWVQQHFKPLLQARLVGHLSSDPRIFLDMQNIETGTDWPSEIEQALLSSKILLPVWSPEFFRRTWCMAEWESFLLRISTLQRKQIPLIFPVKYSDGKTFREDAKNTQCTDLSKWNLSAPAFNQSLDYIDFERKIDEIAQKLADHLDDLNFPEHDPNWQVKSPKDIILHNSQITTMPRM